MYCPQCAVQNNDDARYCRGCGANLSLIPKALTGNLPEGRRGRHRHGSGDAGTAALASGIQKVVTGVGFILVALGAFTFAPAGRLWWFWLLIPAFALMGRGIAEIVTAKQHQLTGSARTASPPPRTTGELEQADSRDFLPPPSVTESTTRLFEEAEDRPQQKV
jgi:hypothetical protein